LGRQLLALGFEVRLIPPAHVKPYVRRNKNDAVDAAAICEAAGRPGQRFVPVRSIENQVELMRHRARELLAGQRTAALNGLRGHLAEIGVVAPQGARRHAYDLKRLAVAGFDEYGEVCGLRAKDPRGLGDHGHDPGQLAVQAVHRIRARLACNHLARKIRRMALESMVRRAIRAKRAPIHKGPG
jgi:transposase